MQYAQKNPLPIPEIGAYESLSATVETVLDWQYELKRQNLLALYEKGKALAWNANDLDWSIDVDFERLMRERTANGAGAVINALMTPPIPLRDDELIRMQLHMNSFMLSQFLHGEQGALLATAKIVQSVPWEEAKFYAANQVADEARHVEVFARRAALRGGPLGVSTTGGRASLQTLLDEPDFSLASFLLSVLGEGTFLNLLSFIETYAPDTVTRQIAHLALQDEARHVAFGLAHLEHGVEVDPGLLGRLRLAIERRHDALASTAGLNQDVFDALVVLAAGAWTPDAIASGYERVQALTADMDDGRRRRLARLGFPADEAAELSALHTRNFM
jgi:hypothetical protein